LEFIKNTKWEEYVGDSTVQTHLNSIKERITSLQAQKKPAEGTASKPATTAGTNDADLTNSARVKLGKKKNN
jgi:hypothetical protein